MSIYPDLEMLTWFEAKRKADMTPAELAQADQDKTDGEKWNADHPVHAKHVIAHWNQATDDEKEAGKNWYEDGHNLCKHVANDTGRSTHQVAGLLANYSPQTHWATNILTAAKVARTGKGVGGPGSGVMASTYQKDAADRIIGGESHDSVFKGPKIKAFAHLNEHGGNEDDDDPKVCADRHALSVASGSRASDNAYMHSKMGKVGRYKEVADTYHEAAKQISKKVGYKVHPHQVQATTWLTRQRLNEEQDKDLSKTATSRSASRAKGAIKEWNKYAAEHHPSLLGKVPGTGYSKEDAPDDVQHAQDLQDEGRPLQKAANRISVYPDLFKVAHDSGDGQTIYHCPFCGSGQVIARSDKTVECEFCHTAFTVQVQPEYPSFPQTINGMPVDVPGMPGQIGEEAGAEPGMETDEDGNPVDPAEGMDDSSEVPPGEDGAEEGSEGPPGAGGGFAGKPGPSNQPPWLKGSSKAAQVYQNLWGAKLSEDAYIKHLALAAADDPRSVLVAIRVENEGNG